MKDTFKNKTITSEIKFFETNFIIKGFSKILIIKQTTDWESVGERERAMTC